MMSRFACVLVATAAIGAGGSGGSGAKGTEPLSGRGPLNGENAFALVKQALPKPEANQEVTLVGTVEGKFVSLADNKLSTVGPAMALMVNFIEKKADLGVTHWAPHLFLVKSKGDQIEVVSHLEPLDLTNDVDATVDQGSKLSLTTLQVTKEANAIVAILRKAEGNSVGGNIEETMVVYLVQKATLAIAFSTKSEVTSSEKVDGVMKTDKEVNKVELGKKGNKLADLTVTTRKYEIKGDQTEEYKPTTDRWCWNDKATSYMPECK